MLGETVQFGDVLKLTGLSMVIVFSCLFVISLLVDLLKLLVGGGKEKSQEQVTPAPAVLSDRPINEEEFLPVFFAAAIAASSGKSPAQIYIRSMKIINQEDER